MSALKVIIQSFSFFHDQTWTDTEHGGGFVFDCRCIDNPGRQEEFKRKTGFDSGVKEFIEALPEATPFFEHVSGLIEAAISKYQSRGYDSLSVSFGCTGGQHRSVYFANRLADSLSGRNDLSVTVSHPGLIRMNLLPDTV